MSFLRLFLLISLAGSTSLFSKSTDLPKLSVKTWNSLEESKRKEILSDLEISSLNKTYSDYKIFNFTEKDLQNITGIKQKEMRFAILKILKAASDNISTEQIEQSTGPETGNATVGGQVPMEIFLLVSEKKEIILGGSIRLLQNGASKIPSSDEDSFSFKDKKTALEAGFEDADISWQAFAIFDKNLVFYDDGAYFEWSGH